MPRPSYSSLRKRERSVCQAHTRFKFKRILLWAIAIAVVLGFGWTQFKGQALDIQIKRFSGSAISLSLAAVLLQVFCQTARLWFLFPKKSQLSWKRAAIAFIRGQFIGNWVSTQAGYAVKIWHIRPKSDQTSRLSLVAATAIIFLDKIIDVAILAGLSLAGGIWLLRTKPPSGQKGYAAFQRRIGHAFNTLTAHPIWLMIAIVCLITGLGLIVWITSHPSEKIKRVRGQLREATGFLKSPVQTMGATLMGTGDWIFEMLSLQVLCESQGYDLNFAQTTLCLLILNLGISIPSGIANVGSFEAALTFALTRFGLPLDKSLAIAVVYHLLQLAGITLWYLLTTLWKQQSPIQMTASNLRESSPEAVVPQTFRDAGD